MLAQVNEHASVSLCPRRAERCSLLECAIKQRSESVKTVEVASAKLSEPLHRTDVASTRGAGSRAFKASASTESVETHSRA
eukprot:5025021-Pleurochrysis_carterae.AAC.1